MPQYGKVFEEIYYGTLMDDGGADAAYVFISMIVLSDKNGILKHSASSLARIIRKETEEVEQAIAFLCRPDPHSNLSEHDGRRIVPLAEIEHETGKRGWLVVNKSHYRELGGDIEARRAADAERQRRKRAKEKDIINNKRERSDQIRSGGSRDCHVTSSLSQEKQISKKPRFTPPGLGEVKTYVEEMQYGNCDPVSFYAFYESNGWMVGKNKMKDWKAAVRTWQYRDRR